MSVPEFTLARLFKIAHFMGHIQLTSLRGLLPPSACRADTHVSKAKRGAPSATWAIRLALILVDNRLVPHPDRGGRAVPLPQSLRYG